MKKLISVFFILIILSASCVPKKKLVISETNIVKLQKQNENTLSQLKECNEKVAKLNDDKIDFKNDNDLALKELKVISDASNTTISDQAKRLKALQDIIQAQKNSMTKLNQSIADALISYQANELYIYTKDGNVYILLEESLLFKSGSDVIDVKGKDALRKLAKAINNVKDINIMIEGHTDDIPINTARFKDNWDLSTARATTILRVLTNEFGFDPKRITASGRGKFHPVKSNDTPEGRASNRRTEIIISPDLNELFKILYQ